MIIIETSNSSYDDQNLFLLFLITVWSMDQYSSLVDGNGYK